MKAILIGEYNDGQTKRVTTEIFSELKRQGVEATVVFVGNSLPDSLVAPLKEVGVNKVVFLEHADLATYSTEGYANAVHAWASTQSPSLIVTGATAQGKDYLPRLAAKFSVGLATDCTEVKISGETIETRRPVYAGKCSKTVTFAASPAIFSVRPNVLPVAKASGSAAVEKVAANPGKIRARVVEVKGGGVKKVELTEADIIISGGRSLKASENFKILHDCAGVIGAAVGASRAAVDAGLAPHDMQVGQTGKTVSPKLYIACGISGAIQHLAGMRTSKVIVAINKDPEAPIFQKADYGVVADLFEAVPLLTEELKKLKAHS